MQEYLIFTGAVTYAIKGRDILRKNGIRAEVKKVSGNDSGVGCGYAILVKNSIRTAEKLLIDSGIKILKISKR